MPAFRITRRYLGFDTVNTGSGERIRIGDSGVMALAELGFDWIWFLSVWQTGPSAQRVSRSDPDWRREFQETLPDLREEDIAAAR